MYDCLYNLYFLFKLLMNSICIWKVEWEKGTNIECFLRYSLSICTLENVANDLLLVSLVEQVWDTETSKKGIDKTLYILSFPNCTLMEPHSLDHPLYISLFVYIRRKEIKLQVAWLELHWEQGGLVTLDFYVNFFYLYYKS